jgi:hypothetical protein
MRIPFPPGFPGSPVGSKFFEPLSGQRASNRHLLQLGPKALCLVIVKKDIALVKPSGNAEGVNLFIDSSGVDYSRLSERSKSDDDGETINGIVDHLMPVKDFYRKYFGLTPQSYPDDLIIALEKIGFIGLDKFGLQQGRDPIFGRTSREDLLFGYNRIIQSEGCKYRRGHHGQTEYQESSHALLLSIMVVSNEVLFFLPYQRSSARRSSSGGASKAVFSGDNSPHLQILQLKVFDMIRSPVVHGKTEGQVEVAVIESPVPPHTQLVAAH